MTKTILITAFESFDKGPRILYPAETAQQLGYTVEVVSVERLGFAPHDSCYSHKGIHVRYVPIADKTSIMSFCITLFYLFSGHFPAKTLQLSRQRMPLRTFFNVFIFNCWIIRYAWSKKINCIYCHEPSSLPGAWLTAKLKKIPLLYDVWDPHFDVKDFVKRTPFWGKVEKVFVPTTDTVIAASRSLENYMQSIGAQHTLFLPNLKKKSSFSFLPEELKAFRQSLDLDDKPIFTYIGLLPPERSLDALLDAAACTPEITFLIGGQGEEGIVQKAQNYGKKYSNIRWLGWIPIENHPKYTALSDVIYVVYTPGSAFARHILPNKLFESFMVGAVLLALDDNSELAQFLRESQTGYLVPDNSLKTIQKAFIALTDSTIRQPIAERTKKIGETFNWEDYAKPLLTELFEQTCIPKKK